MGSCLSKRGSASSPTSKTAPARVDAASNCLKDINVDASHVQKKVTPQQPKKDAVVPEEATGLAKKEVFVIKHRKSHDRTAPETEKSVPVAEPEVSAAPKTDIVDIAVSIIGNTHLRTTKEEEVDAILIQCGRLSHSNSHNSAAIGGRRYSGSKRSYDFDHPVNESGPADVTSSDTMGNGDDERQLRRSQGIRSRRRTPSRERDQQRSGSRERGPGGRRVSRSPGRRSEMNPNPTANAAATETKPGKIVSVPATVSSMVNASETAGSTQQTAAVRRVTVKRNVGASNEAAASRSSVPASPRPRSHSPARRTKEAPQQQQQQQPASLSRSSSRKAEQSPLRRNPLSDVDTNKISSAAATCKIINNKENEMPTLKSNVDMMSNKRAVQGHREAEKDEEEGAAVKVHQEVERQTPQKLTRSRSSRRSFDNLEFNPDSLPKNPNSSYTALLLEDIQNFHQKNTSTTPFTLPPCVSKAHSIFQAVADLNSNAASTVSSVYSEERKSQPSYQYSTNCCEFKSSSGLDLVGNGKKKPEPNKEHPFVESEVDVDDDLMEPSFHKYVTVKRGGAVLKGEGDKDEIESSGSNSFMSGATPHQQQWDLPSEPGSADSSDCWTSRSNATSDLSNDARRKLNGKNRDAALQQNAVARGRVRCR